MAIKTYLREGRPCHMLWAHGVDAATSSNLQIPFTTTCYDPMTP